MPAISIAIAEPIDYAALSRRGLMPAPFRLYEMVDHAAARNADGAWVSNRNAIETLTFSAAASLSLELAHGLLGQDFKTGDRIAICVPNHPVFAATMLGVWRAGGAVSGLHPAYADDLLVAQLRLLEPWALVILDEPEHVARFSRLAREAGVTKVIAAPSTGPLSAIAATAGEVTSFHTLISRGAKGDLPRPDLDTPAVLQFTGGSTGAPKAATLTHATLSINLAQFASLFPKLRYGEERFLGLAPLAHILGLNLTANIAAYFGSEIVLERRFDADETARLCGERRISFFGGVPTMLAALNGSEVARHVDWSALTYAAAGGAPVLTSIKQTFEAMTGCTVLQGYGLSETSPAAVFTRPTEEAPVGCAGRPVPATRVEIRDVADPMRVLPTGEVGEIVIAGPQMMRGYWRNPEETRAALVDGVLRTGDLGKLDAEGRLFILDRLKDLIISSGFNLYPARIENAIAQHPNVREVAVVGTPDGYRGEIVRAIVALRDSDSLSLDDLQSFLVSRLSSIEMPRLLDIVENLPKSPAGKILRREAGAMHRDGVQQV